MTEEEARRLIKSTFETAFDRGQFGHFITELLNLDEEDPQDDPASYITEAYQPYIDHKERICGYETEDSRNIDVLIVTLKQNTSLIRARSMQRNYIAQHLRQKEKDAALVAYVGPDKQDWRFSLIAVDDTKTDQLTVTPAKRFSFLVGESESSHTAQRRLIPILRDEEDIALEKLRDAFSVEKVNREFFGQYRDLFLKLHDALLEDTETRAYFDTEKIDVVNFTKKLLGQIVFLYFLQKKGWLGVAKGAKWGEGAKNFLRKCFTEKPESANFFHQILEPLFYDALNKEHTDDYYEQLGYKIPFLNGGLFEPIKNYDWKKARINLPNKLFSNKTEEFIGDGVLDVFDRYNFTVKEDEPLDKEVAIDPELLGSIYEKFNAINADNFVEYKKATKQGRGQESRFNKQHGVYYTPRIVVHYMCQQSLINYLSSKFQNIKHEDIVKLIDHGSDGIEDEQAVAKLPQSIHTHKQALDEALQSIRVCDPAIGSGAFPVGMMEEIVKARHTLDHLSSESTKQSTHYALKRHCIENCLYGVDLDEGAVEIARLRLWLSLVVDEEDMQRIEPLPNLDYKVVCANSLLQIEDNTMFRDANIERIEGLKEDFKNETDVAKKVKIRWEIQTFLGEEFSFNNYFSEVFHRNGGFDIVITNPPYIKVSYNQQKFRPVNKSVFGETYHEPQMDYWYYFLHKAIDVTKEKGIIAFITSSYWLKNDGAKTLIRHIKEALSFIHIVDFGDLKIFDSVDGNHMIAIYRKEKNKGPLIYKKLIHSILDIDVKKTIKGLVQFKTFHNSKIFTEWDDMILIVLGVPFLIDTPRIKHLGTITSISKGVALAPAKLTKRQIDKLSNEDISNKHQFEAGDGVFILSKDEFEHLNLNQEERAIIKKHVKSKDVDRYNIVDSQQYLIYSDDSTGRRIAANDPTLRRLRRHLDKYQRFISSSNKPYCIQDPVNPKYFEGPKIIFNSMFRKGVFALDENKFYFNSSCHSLIQTNPNYDLKYILAILNSKLALCWFDTYGKKRGKMIDIGVKRLSKFPIKDITRNEQSELIKLVDKRSVLPNSPEYETKAKEIEDKIDQIVYKLYGVPEAYVKKRWEDLGNKWE